MGQLALSFEFQDLFTSATACIFQLGLVILALAACRTSARTLRCHGARHPLLPRRRIQRACRLKRPSAKWCAEKAVSQNVDSGPLQRCTCMAAALLLAGAMPWCSQGRIAMPPQRQATLPSHQLSGWGIFQVLAAAVDLHDRGDMGRPAKRVRCEEGGANDSASAGATTVGSVAGGEEGGGAALAASLVDPFVQHLGQALPVELAAEQRIQVKWQLNREDGEEPKVHPKACFLSPSTACIRLRLPDNQS